MWELRPIDAAGGLFLVTNGSVRLARSVLDPTIPWTLVEQHHSVGNVWKTMRLPLNASESALPRRVRARWVGFDFMLPTEEFIDAIAELGNDQAGIGGIAMWQLDREPSRRVRFGELLFDPNVDLHAVYREHGVRLWLLVPHENEVSSVAAVDPADLQRAWDRVRSENGSMRDH
jgi:hypothetical protein